MSSKQQIEATTTATSEECRYTWTINNYNLIKTEVGESISSPKFYVGSDNKQFFKLDLYPEGKESAGFISLFLTYEGTDSTKKPDKLICKSTIYALKNMDILSSCEIHQDFVKSPTGGPLEFFELKSKFKWMKNCNYFLQCKSSHGL
ncbi:uncharacterized protein LOC106650704 [Trichogramma pretiosum]|uniref:uncharacterized protein LOC106650704 n=1 Tax=Trichogramma pretiosum TaxID=7493 RepID=UPI0006C95268|nr:uncharacterized protein LOC106650704 [Trichogramma pretiosum]